MILSLLEVPSNTIIYSFMTRLLPPLLFIVIGILTAKSFCLSLCLFVPIISKNKKKNLIFG